MIGTCKSSGPNSTLKEKSLIQRAIVLALVVVFAISALAPMVA
jgi:hypothetical protein